MPLVSRGMTKGESDWCQVVAPVTSHTGTGTPVGDPQIFNFRASQEATSLYMISAGIFKIAVCF